MKVSQFSRTKTKSDQINLINYSMGQLWWDTFGQMTKEANKKKKDCLYIGLKIHSKKNI